MCEMEEFGHRVEERDSEGRERCDGIERKEDDGESEMLCGKWW